MDVNLNEFSEGIEMLLFVIVYCIVIGLIGYFRDPDPEALRHEEYYRDN